MVWLRSYCQTVALFSSYNTPALRNSNSHCKSAIMAAEKLTATELSGLQTLQTTETTETTACSSSDSDYSLQAGAPAPPPTGHGPGRLSSNPHLLLHN